MQTDKLLQRNRVSIGCVFLKQFMLCDVNLVKTESGNRRSGSSSLVGEPGIRPSTPLRLTAVRASRPGLSWTPPNPRWYAALRGLVSLWETFGPAQRDRPLYQLLPILLLP